MTDRKEEGAACPMRLALKCAAEERFLDLAAEAGAEAVELYTDARLAGKLDATVALCRRYPFAWAVHAPVDGSAVEAAVSLADALSASAVVLHCVYWEDEWPVIARLFRGRERMVCVENLGPSVLQYPVLRRYGFRRCLDLEHLILEVDGIPEDFLHTLLPQVGHVHMTGYTPGGEAWHTPVHHAPEQGRRLLDILLRGGYRGLVVSEAAVRHQTAAEFRATVAFFDGWRRARGLGPGQTPAAPVVCPSGPAG